MEGVGRKGDQDRTKYPEFNPILMEEIDSYLGLILYNGIRMNPQINFWFLQTHDSTIYGNNNVSKFFPRGRRIWHEFKRFLCMYDPLTEPKYYAEKFSLQGS